MATLSPNDGRNVNLNPKMTSKKETCIITSKNPGNSAKNEVFFLNLLYQRPWRLFADHFWAQSQLYPASNKPRSHNAFLLLPAIPPRYLTSLFTSTVSFLLTVAFFQVGDGELSFLAHWRTQESSALVEYRFINYIFFRRSSHAKHKRVPIRFRAYINSSSVRETLNPRVVSVIYEFQNVAFKHARNVTPEASVSDFI